MGTASLTTELLDFFKALADTNRLKIVGLLAGAEHTVEQLAAMLDLRPSTVSHHLARLAEIGLVSARADGHYHLYRLETDALEAMARRLLSQENLQEVAAEVDLDAFDRKVIATFSLPDGRLKALPAQRKKMEAILRHVVRDFEPGVRYPEKQVNKILGRYHQDTATLRRELFEYGLLAREGGGRDYWRTEE